MTNTREEVAVAEAIAEALFTTHGFASSQPMIEAAKAAIAASNSKYVPMLVEALKEIADKGTFEDKTTNGYGRSQTIYAVIAKKALSQLPEELRNDQ